MRSLTHQKQPCQRSCVAACIAMVTGQPVDDVKLKFHFDYRDNLVTPASYLRGLGMSVRECTTSESLLMTGNVYLMCVPSLNNRGGNHEVILDLRGRAHEVLDPQKGNEGKYYYTLDTDDKNPLSFELKGRTIDAEIVGLDAWLTKEAIK